MNNTTATSPFANGLASTSAPPEDAISRPALPSESWSTAMTSLFVYSDSVAVVALRRSVPEISGAAISAHSDVSARSSVKDIPLPTSSMSGSFQPPGPAEDARPTVLWKLDSMLPKLALMSPVVRHRLPTPAPQVQTDS